VEPTPRQRLYFHRVADGCLQAACAVSLVHPWATGPRFRRPTGATDRNPLSIRNSHLMVAVD
jgi:hypothetical protein